MSRHKRGAPIHELRAQVKAAQAKDWAATRLLEAEKAYRYAQESRDPERYRAAAEELKAAEAAALFQPEKMGKV